MKKKMVIFLILLILLTGCSQQSAAEETGIADPVTVQDHLELYRPVLERYAQALTEEWNMEQYSDAGLSSQVFNYIGNTGLHSLGYSLLDLDGDSVMELLIGIYEDGHVMDAYRLNNAEPERLFASMNYLEESGVENADFLWEDWYLCQENLGEFFLYHQVQQDWLISGYFRVVMEQGLLRVTESFVYNSIVDPYNPWYRVDGFVLDYAQGEPVSQEEAGMTIYEYELAMVPMNTLENSWQFSDFS